MILGKCSLCGGNVVVPDYWFGIYPPVPTCASCFATKKDETKVIPMEKPGKNETWTTPKPLLVYSSSNDDYKITLRKRD